LAIQLVAQEPAKLGYKTRMDVVLALAANECRSGAARQRRAQTIKRRHDADLMKRSL
jgi:hypothetical protein